MAKSSRYASGKHCASIPATHYAGVGSSVAACNPLSEIQEITKKLHFLELVDDTALIDTSLISEGKINSNRRQEIKINAVMKKRPHRRVRRDWKIKKICVAADKKVYSRAEMVALSFQNVEDQRNKWSEVYAGLAASVAAEYDGLLVAPL